MFRIRQSTVGATLVLAVLSLQNGFRAPWAPSAWAQTPSDEPAKHAPGPPFRRPALPERPGTIGGRWTPPRRPGMAEPKAARYVMEITGAKRVTGVYRSEVFTTNSPVKEWEAYFPAAAELSRQKLVRSSMEPPAQVIREASRAHRQVLQARLPVERVEAPQTVTLAVRYEGTLLARRLAPVRAGQPASPVPPLDFNERFVYLAPTATLDFRADLFQAWLQTNRLRRGENEEDVEFARRVFTAMLSLYTYRDGVEPGPISSLCDLSVLDCDTLSLLFVGAMRAGGVPARVVYGWPTRPLRHTKGRPLSGHTQAEFFAGGVGWVPVDLSYGLLHRDDNPMVYFGEDEGNLLIVQIDPDYIVPHPNGQMERIISIHPGPSVWARGPAKPDTAIRPLSWDVEVSPLP